MQTIYDAKILIVDDNQDLLNLVTTALRSTGYNQLTAPLNSVIFFSKITSPRL